MIIAASRYESLEQKHEKLNQLLRMWAVLGAGLLTLAVFV